MKRFLLFVAGALILAGCSGGAVPLDVSSPDVSSSSRASSSSPASPNINKCVGGEVSLGDWKLSIVKVQTNANAVIKEVNEFNEKPKYQYILITYKATYDGKDRKGNVDAELRWTLTGTDKIVQDPTSQVTPYSNKPTEARKGGTITQQVVFDARPVGALLSVETLFGDEYTECRL